MPKKSKAQQQEDNDFDNLLKELQTKTKESGQAKEKKQKHKQKPASEDHQDKRAKHKELMDAINKAKEAEFERALERQQQQRRIQQMIEQMQNGGGGPFGMTSPFLDKPKTEVETQVTSNDLFDVATASMQGWRRSMEDAHCNDLNFSESEKAGLFAVFDGHAGGRCAQVAKFALPALTKRHYDAAQVAAGCPFFETVYAELDHSLKDKCTDNSGATAVTALVTSDYVTCANVGDSRAVLCRGGKNFDLSCDHKPEDADERARIEAAGGMVENNRVNGQLAMSRAIGDFTYKSTQGLPADKQLVISVPEIISTKRQKDDEFLVVACDGIFDVLSNEEVIAFVRESMTHCSSLSEVCTKLVEHCLAPEVAGGNGPTRSVGTDNMTVTIIKFK